MNSVVEKGVIPGQLDRSYRTPQVSRVMYSQQEYVTLKVEIKGVKHEDVGIMAYLPMDLHVESTVSTHCFAVTQY